MNPLNGDIKEKNKKEEKNCISWVKYSIFKDLLRAIMTFNLSNALCQPRFPWNRMKGTPTKIEL